MNSKLRLDVIAIIISIIAAVFAGGATVFAGLQWLEARQQRLLTFQASIGFEIDTDLTQRRLGIAIHNVGPGIASLRSVTYYMDHKAVNDSEFDDALTAVRLDPDREVGLILEPGEPLAVGQISWLFDLILTAKVARAGAIRGGRDCTESVDHGYSVPDRLHTCMRLQVRRSAADIEDCAS
jgi:hypothetical protein